MVKSESGGLELIEAHAPMGIRSRSSSACTACARVAELDMPVRHITCAVGIVTGIDLGLPGCACLCQCIQLGSRALIRPCAASYSAGVPMMRGAMVQCSSRRMRGVPMHGRGRSQASLGGQHFKPTDGSGHLTEQRFGMVRYRNSERPILWCRSYNFVV